MAPPALVLEDRYQLDDQIALGGMGEVWRAQDLLLNRPVAVKLLRPAFAGDENGLIRFRAEARYAGSLSHPNIAQIYDYGSGEPPARPYLVMELVDGPSLAALLADGPLDVAHTLAVVGQAAAGLQAAHAAGLVHRDVKPGNLLVSKAGQVKIADFGIAHAVESAPVTRTGELVGTPAYLSPEQVTGAPATSASDLYALGIVAYQCLTGEVPFTGEPLAVALAHQERGLPPLPPAVPLGVAALVAALTAKDPQARPASAGHVAQRAEHLRAGLAVEPGAGRAAVALVPPVAAAFVPPTAVDLPAGAGADASPAPASSPAGAAPAGLTGGPAPVPPGGTAATPAPAGALALSAADGPVPGAQTGELPPMRPPAGRWARQASRWLVGRLAPPLPPARLPPRAALAIAGLVLFGLSGWAVSALTGTPAHLRGTGPPAARPSSPMPGPAASPGATSGSQPVAPPAPSRTAFPGRTARPSASASPSAPATPAPTQSAPPPSPTGQPSPSAPASTSPPASPGSTPSPGAS